MGLEASLKLLDLPSNATIDDANQAYAYLHRMIDLFHQDSAVGARGDRQEDMDLLTSAYEKAVAYLSGQDLQATPAVAQLSAAPARPSADRSTDLHFTINFSADAEKGASASLQDLACLSERNNQTIAEAISITARRLHQTESALPGAQEDVEAALAAAEAASRRHDKAKQASMNAVVTAKSAKTRAWLLDIEAKRAMDDAIATAERARDRVVAARQAACEAKKEADKARAQVSRFKNEEETTAAEVVCAEDRLEKAKSGLKTLTHTLLQTRGQMKIFQGSRADTEAHSADARVQSQAAMPDHRMSSPHEAGREAEARQQILSDLLQIEASIQARSREPIPVEGNAAALEGAAGRAAERRQHHRVAYPSDRRPILSIDGHTMPVHDLSTAGMCLDADAALDGLPIVRGVIAFPGRPPVMVTGKVVRADACRLGLKLVTRIGNHILDQERLRISA